MLFKQTVKPEVFFLLERLMEEPELKNFRLVGGTALALLKGHRHSDDLDLFTHEEFNFPSVEFMLRRKYADGNALSISTFPYGLSAYYSYSYDEEVKIDIMSFHSEPFLESYQLVDGIRLATLRDIAAMKLQAITGRKHKKDFIDLYILLEDFSLGEMIAMFESRFEFYEKKDVLIALGNVDLADNELMPRMFAALDWQRVKNRIKQLLTEYIRSQIS